LLPGQNLAPILTEQHYVNERGFLVPSPCKANGASCSTSDECCGTSKCAVDIIPAMGAPSKICKDPAACSLIGEACLADADCCGGSPCVGSQCVNTPNYGGGATFERVYEAECPAGFHPLWGLFSHHLTTAGDSHIEVDAQTALTLADLATADVVDLADSTGDNYGAAAEAVDVGASLMADDVSASLTFLQISITLHPSSDGSFAPILHDWEQRYSCVPAE
jgi:hypothetical protein